MAWRHATLVIPLAAAALLPACTEVQEAPARHDFSMWVRADIEPQIEDGSVLVLSGKHVNKLRLGKPCSGSEAEFGMWIVIATETGHVYDIVTNGIPNNGSLIVDTTFLGTCTDGDGQVWREYQIDLDKA